jgi:hypothetical protein
MGTRRLIPLTLFLLVLGTDGVYAQSAVQPSATAPEGSPQITDASTIMLPCTPVAAYWTGPPPSPGMPPGPQLAVVSVVVRPKDVRVHLDDRFVGRARYLDGKPGYLYLEPGSYRLELRLEGYRSIIVELDATAACRYDLKHRLERGSSEASDRSEIAYGKGKPFNRVFGPIQSDKPAVAAMHPVGPDPSLRSDLNRRSGTAADADRERGASIHFRVSPESASVSIDGVFVATGRELGLMERPLATTAGEHHVVVRAPGYFDASKRVELGRGEVLELEFTLSEKQTN